MGDAVEVLEGLVDPPPLDPSHLDEVRRGVLEDLNRLLGPALAVLFDVDLRPSRMLNLATLRLRRNFLVLELVEGVLLYVIDAVAPGPRLVPRALGAA